MAQKRKAHPNSLAAIAPHKFKPGAPGRPKGSRSLLDASFVEALYADFQAHGVQAIADMRTEDPIAYCKTIAAILPKDVNVSVNASETFERLLRAISDGTAVDTGAVGESVPQEPGQPPAVCH